jgi:hypothetical protein
MIDPGGVWLGLCLNDDLAKARCVAFLKAYVKDSKQEFPILIPLGETREEPQETEWKGTVTSAHSLLNIWRSLIAEADATVLLEKRRQDPAKKDIWRLRFMDHTNRLGQGPVYEVSKVGQTSLPHHSPVRPRDDVAATPSPRPPPPPPHPHLTPSVACELRFLSVPFPAIVADHLTTNSGFSKRALPNSSYTLTCSLRR